MVFHPKSRHIQFEGGTREEKLSLIAELLPKKQKPSHRPTQRHRDADQPGGDPARLGPMLLVHRLAFLAQVLHARFRRAEFRYEMA